MKKISNTQTRQVSWKLPWIGYKSPTTDQCILSRTTQHLVVIYSTLSGQKTGSLQTCYTTASFLAPSVAPETRFHAEEPNRRHIEKKNSSSCVRLILILKLQCKKTRLTGVQIHTCTHTLQPQIQDSYKYTGLNIKCVISCFDTAMAPYAHSHKQKTTFWDTELSFTMEDKGRKYFWSTRFHVTQKM